MKRSIFALAGAVALTLASVGSVTADKPVRGCPDGFELWSIEAFQGYLLSDEFVDSLSDEGQLLAEEFQALIATQEWFDAAAAYDKNGDGNLCIKPGPANRGHLYGWVFNAVDNTSNH